MSQTIQCPNCGAVLTEEDAFCGECGAPRAPMPAVAQPPEAIAPPPVPPTTPPPARSSDSSETRWRVAFIVLLAAGAFFCLGGVASFLLFGLTGSETYTTEENWLYASLCCLVPIAGTGAILAASGAAIWYTRLRDR